MTEQQEEPVKNYAFINSDEPPKEVKHICYFTTRSNMDGDGKIHLMQVVEEVHPHPDAPEYAVVSLTRTRFVRAFRPDEVRAAYAIMLEAAQQNTRNVEKMTSTF